ncbi:MAG TPA: rod shape-determining protein MreC, partial [Verrucomicrobiae bacterium]|nr:rod shape-determining protein MreC [Verrucomicrobiae bacterium]
GKVVSVTANTCEVVLILDSEGQVSGEVRQSEGSASTGVVIGNYERGPVGAKGTLKMTVPKDDKVNPGDLVLTSGLGGVYPQNIPVGTVKEVTMEQGGLLKTATITPAVQFDRLEEVFVVLKGGK